MAKLEWLPVELLCDIFLESSEPSLPLVSRHIHQALSQLPPTLCARYLIKVHTQPPSDWAADPLATFASALGASLRHAVCTVPVVQAIHRLLEPYLPLIPKKREHDIHGTKTGSKKRLCPSLDLPKRLFRTALASTTHMPPSLSPLQPQVPMILSELFAHPDLYTPDVNSHRGYPLTMAVAHRQLELVQFLLDKGADPSMRDALAVKVAIGKRDVALVKLLIERVDYDPSTNTTDGSVVRTTPSRKKRRLEDRVVITPDLIREAVKVDARGIVQYFVVVKGGAPDLKTLDYLTRDRK